MLDRRASLPCFCVLVLLSLVASARAQAQAQVRPNDPLAYDLHVALFPVAFQAGVSQGHFGSAARIEYTGLRVLDVSAFARVPWWAVTGEKDHRGYTLGGGIALHLSESIDQQKLSGTVYPASPPALSGAGSRGADRDLDIPVSQRLSGPMLAPDQPGDLSGTIYSVHLLRLGFTYSRAVHSAHVFADVPTYIDTRMPLLNVGYAFGSQWNLPASLTGKMEIGYRHIYVDALATLPALVDEHALYAPDVKTKIFPVGARVGMEGSIDGFFKSMPGAGFGYSLELGALPARRSIEGYLFVGLGLALDFATR